MADTENTTEVEIEVETPEIEVVSDVPEADQGRTPMQEAPADVTDEELTKYSDQKLKDRLAHLGKGYHEERRAKEAALREREEAFRVAQAAVAENQRLQGSLSTSQTALLEQAKRTVAAEMEEAKRAYKAAHEAFDADALLEAQEKLAIARARVEKVNNYKPPPVQQPQAVVQPQQPVQQVPVLDDKTREWQGRNPWFGANRTMTAYALSLHQDLVESGVPVASDEYYERINGDVKKRFPEAFAGNRADARSSQRAGSNVAPATRSTASKKVVLTQTQVTLAKRLGLPLEVYARSVAEL